MRGLQWWTSTQRSSPDTVVWTTRTVVRRAVWMATLRVAFTVLLAILAGALAAAAVAVLDGGRAVESRSER